LILKKAATFYSDENFRDYVGHNLSLSGRTTYDDWSFRISQNVAITSNPQVETAQQTDHQAYSTGAGIGYQINRDLSFDFNANQNISDVQGNYTNAVRGTRDWFGIAWLNYQWGPNVTIGVGAGYGYTSVDSGVNTAGTNTTGINMTRQDYQGRISWRVARKLTLAVNGGVQVREFLDSDQPTLVSPIFGVSLRYQMFRYTALSLGASRTVSASDYIFNQVTESTGFNAALSQRLFGKYNLGISGGYANTSYRFSISTASGTFGLGGREDDYSFYSVSLSRSFLKRGNASVSYSRSRTSSSAGGFGYSSDQVGFQISYSY